MVNHKCFSNTKHSKIHFINIASEPCVSTELSRSLRSCSIDKDQVLDKLYGRYSPTVPADDDDGNVVVGIIVHTTWVGSGLHVPSSPHTELGGDGANPDC